MRYQPLILIKPVRVVVGVRVLIFWRIRIYNTRDTVSACKFIIAVFKPKLPVCIVNHMTTSAVICLREQERDSDGEGGGPHSTKSHHRGLK